MKRLSSPLIILGVIAIAVVLVVSHIGLVQAQGRGHDQRSGGQQPNHEEMIHRIVEQLDLSEEQTEQMKQIHIEHREATETLRDQMETARTRVNELVDAEQFDEAAIREAAKELAGYQTELFVSRAAVQQEIRQILTPEQYEQLTEMRNRHHGMMMRGHGSSKGGRYHHGHGRPAPEDG